MRVSRSRQNNTKLTSLLKQQWIPTLEMRSLPAVEVLGSLDELLMAQKELLLKVISDSIWNTCSETGQITGEILRIWGTTRIFMQQDSSGAVLGAGVRLLER
eukprot:209771_1